MLEPIRWR